LVWALWLFEWRQLNFIAYAETGFSFETTSQVRATYQGSLLPPGSDDAFTDSLARSAQKLWLIITSPSSMVAGARVKRLTDKRFKQNAFLTCGASRMIRAFPSWRSTKERFRRSTRRRHKRRQDWRRTLFGRSLLWTSRHCKVMYNEWSKALSSMQVDRIFTNSNFLQTVFGSTVGTLEDNNTPCASLDPT